MSPAEVERIVSEQYGFESSVQPLSAERDLNFHVLAEGGQSYVLKIAHPAEEAATSLFQTAALEHVERVDPALVLPRVRRTRRGEPLGSTEGPDAPRRIVRLLTYLPGRLMHTVPATQRLLERLGEAAGRLDFALSSFRHEPPAQDLLWTFEQVSRLRPLLDAVTDPGSAALAEKALDDFERHVEPVQADLPRQVVHNDLNPHNVLCDLSDGDRVWGILDFGDMVHGPRIGEVAVAACYHVAALSDPLAALAACLAGYTRHLPLSEIELDLLPRFVTARLAITVLITEWRAARDPANRAYILRNNPAARTGLAILAKISPEDIRRRLREAGMGEAAK